MIRHLPQSMPRSLLTGFACICLAACGGASAEFGNEPDAHQSAASVEPISTLLADDGSIMPTDPRTTPADSGARTRTGRYASPRQAEQLERALGEAVIQVNVECCGIEGADLALGIAYGVQAALDLPSGTPVLVRSADLRLGASVANHLSEAGYSHVWLVTR